MNEPSCAPLGPQQRTGNTTFATAVGLLVVRLGLAAVFIYHGGQLAFGLFDGPGLAKFADGMAGMHLPLLPTTVWAAMAAYGQFFGGVSMLLGLCTRLGALPLLINMFVAIITVHAKNGFNLHNNFEQGGGYEYCLIIIAQCVLILLAGPGLISLDALLFGRGFWAIGPQPLSNPVVRTV